MNATLDLGTAEGALRFAELRRNEMRATFERDGEYSANGYSFCGFVFETHEILTPSDGSAPRTGAKHDQPVAMLVQLPHWVQFAVPPSGHTEVFKLLLAKMAETSRACGHLFLSEMWHVHIEADDLETARKKRAEMPALLEHAGEQRCESLFAVLDHVQLGRRSWAARILRDPTRLEPWQEQLGGAIHGRFAGIVETRS